ncbi:MAG: hypothetical protein COA58_03765 [Bacteroidetes bacterium]|nr:MAG: hypothetical protein COA58_03765 [Bacteroidota bacterium]
MGNDKVITATLMDAVYIGVEQEGYSKNTSYRLRAVRSKGDVIRVKTHKPIGEILTYGSTSHFESAWVDVVRVGVMNW